MANRFQSQVIAMIHDSASQCSPETSGLSPQRLKLLQNMPIFGALSADAINFIESRCIQRQVQARQAFFYEDDPASSIFVLETGNAEVMKQCGDEMRQLRQLGPGDSFGEMAVVDMNPRGATVRAITDCDALELPAAALYELYQYDLEQFTLIQMNMLREISRRLRYLNAKLAATRPDILETASKV
ncbi:MULTISPECIES: Crp/Fnr family transcriptional regulator [Oceanospirillaceae]|uniref:Crp/Fnr family transcriptional regulator n=1 Tax=Oceanobacter antarcticus TaxID=3133425 RepID=A0ABW8NJ27_9GAMM|tara:strand:- start:6085 stop:6642 length:558 start_codon:yes stop_codon:yes gene_type:complete